MQPDAPLLPDDGPLARLVAARAERGASLPSLGVVVLAGEADADTLVATLRRIPPELRTLVAEIAVLRETPEGACRDDGPLQALGWPFLRVLHEPRRYGYGGRRKIALAYACDRGFDAVALVGGDGGAPPEAAPALLAAVALEGSAVAVGVRPFARGSGGALGSLGRRAAARAHELVLGVRLGDWDSGCRAYATSFLRIAPFRLVSDGRGFDTEILVQCRVLGAPVHAVPVPPFDGDAGGLPEWRRQLSSLVTAFAYRLHQLHLVRRGQYLIFDEAWRYTLKRSPTSSHMQIVDAVAPGARVLDLGCSQGLLARPLREKGARVTGVDVRPPSEVSPDLEVYHQRDLEHPLDLPEGRVFDVVVLSDVIEHLRARQDVLLAARRHLKPEGRLLVSTGNVAVWFYRLSLLVGRFEYGPKGILDETHVHLYTRASFRREIERAGFRVLRERATSLPFEVVLRSTGRSRLVQRISGAYHLLARAWPALFAYQFVLEAEATTFYDEPPTARDAAAPERP